MLDGAALTDLWVLGDGVFDASVEVCAPVLVRSSGEGATRLHTGRHRVAGEEVPAPAGTDRSWSGLLADHGGLPRRTLETDGTLGDLASATADFRDQYYGLAPHVVEQVDAVGADGSHRPALVTTGLIDPGGLAWGRRVTRFNKAPYLHPRVDLAALEPALRTWAASRLVPKVLVATQTRVLEAVVDETGELLPSVPVISVVAPAADLWRVAAVLTCPAVALEAARRHLGSGRNAQAMRLRAQEVRRAAAPRGPRGGGTRRPRCCGPARRWPRWAGCMDEAYGLVGDEELLAWWLGLLPPAA